MLDDITLADPATHNTKKQSHPLRKKHSPSHPFLHCRPILSHELSSQLLPWTLEQTWKGWHACQPLNSTHMPNCPDQLHGLRVGPDRRHSRVGWSIPPRMPSRSGRVIVCSYQNRCRRFGPRCMQDTRSDVSWAT